MKREIKISPKGIWSPMQVSILCFFFGFIVGGIMNAISYGRIGNTAKRLRRFILVVVGFIILARLRWIAPDNLHNLFVLFNLITVILFYFDQKKLYIKFITHGGQRADIGSPLVIIIVVIGTSLIIAPFLSLLFS